MTTSYTWKIYFISGLVHSEFTIPILSAFLPKAQNVKEEMEPLMPDDKGFNKPSTVFDQIDLTTDDKGGLKSSWHLNLF